MGTYTGNYPFTEGREELSRDPSIALRWVVERRSGIHEWIAAEEYVRSIGLGGFIGRMPIWWLAALILGRGIDNYRTRLEREREKHKDSKNPRFFSWIQEGIDEVTAAEDAFRRNDPEALPLDVCW